MELMKIFLVLFYLVHWIGCIFYFMGDLERRMGYKNWISDFHL